jgi:rhomboid protease GluP
VLTRVLVAINVIVYLWERFSGVLTSDPSMVDHGALVGALVEQGQWWRIVTSAFLHGNELHIVFNMIALWQVGSYVEMIYGTPRMAVIYAISMLGGGLLITLWTPADPTIGASGAIFGLFGALVVAGMRLGQPGRQLLQQSVGIIVLNLIIGFTLPGISNAGHIGGLVAGFACGIAVFRTPRPQPVRAQPGYAQRIDARNDLGVVTIDQPADDPAPPEPAPPHAS